MIVDGSTATALSRAIAGRVGPAIAMGGLPFADRPDPRLAGSGAPEPIGSSLIMDEGRAGVRHRRTGARRLRKRRRARDLGRAPVLSGHPGGSETRPGDFRSR